MTRKKLSFFLTVDDDATILTRKENLHFSSSVIDRGKTDFPETAMEHHSSRDRNFGCRICNNIIYSSENNSIVISFSNIERGFIFRENLSDLVGGIEFCRKWIHSERFDTFELLDAVDGFGGISGGRHRNRDKIASNIDKKREKAKIFLSNTRDHRETLQNELTFLNLEIPFLQFVFHI